MKKGRIFIIGLIGLLMAGGLFLASCGAKCGGSCEVYWTADGKSSGLSACGAYDCAKDCIVFQNATRNKDGAGMNIHYTCDC